MCFSATASFGVSAVLMAGGIASVRAAKSPNQAPFATIPFVFSVQQFCEGIIWLSLTKPEYESFGGGATYAFLVFAQVIWPTLVPYSMYIMEEQASRKKILRVLLITGLVLSSYLLFSLFYYPAAASISTMHIRYDLARPYQFVYFTSVLYFVSTIVPPFISSISRMFWIGFLSLASFLITVVFFSENIISIWCFFAATISVGVFLVLKKKSVAIKNIKTVQS
jgi:hypothetical protein